MKVKYFFFKDLLVDYSKLENINENIINDSYKLKEGYRDLFEEIENQEKEKKNYELEIAGLNKDKLELVERMKDLEEAFGKKSTDLDKRNDTIKEMKCKIHYSISNNKTI